MKEDEKPFLSRWSERKLKDPPEDETPEPALDETREEDVAGEDETIADSRLLEDMGLPDPDTLRKGDDFSGFMQSGIPSRIRNRALRQLWKSNPVLANLDGLVDHGEDYTDAATVKSDMRTLYEVGKGMFSATQHAVEKAAALAELDESENTEKDDGQDVVDQGEDLTPAISCEEEKTKPEVATAAGVRRRMQFTFDE
ncbi:DUF3306 domain-containing protein [Algicella marina]|uniref:DUF3306 domain-containing protein n=1 Tax=Algicella marina TaxID=2683284 RepID=A0A6P1T430_9RHOB|nr:DUF3306 domain-containing protein [Algicella marina]QHQ35282.1 DUF3306 domain-containing protein [Algicella marina]